MVRSRTAQARAARLPCRCGQKSEGTLRRTTREFQSSTRGRVYSFEGKLHGSQSAGLTFACGFQRNIGEIDVVLQFARVHTIQLFVRQRNQARFLMGRDWFFGAEFRCPL